MAHRQKFILKEKQKVLFDSVRQVFCSVGVKPRDASRQLLSLSLQRGNLKLQVAAAVSQPFKDTSKMAVKSRKRVECCRIRASKRRNYAQLESDMGSVCLQ